jgi:hypothetical protein
MKRLGAFLRSVIPADPTQLIFLAGTVLLFVSPRVPWWPSRNILDRRQWAAIHFRSDTYSGLSFGGVLVHLANRIFLCLALNYVFAWLTLRQGSIIPAAIAHTVWNILASVQSHSGDGWELEFRLCAGSLDCLYSLPVLAYQR